MLSMLKYASNVQNHANNLLHNASNVLNNDNYFKK